MIKSIEIKNNNILKKYEYLQTQIELVRILKTITSASLFKNFELYCLYKGVCTASVKSGNYSFTLKTFIYNKGDYMVIIRTVVTSEFVRKLFSTLIDGSEEYFKKFKTKTITAEAFKTSLHPVIDNIYSFMETYCVYDVGDITKTYPNLEINFAYDYKLYLSMIQADNFKALPKMSLTDLNQKVKSIGAVSANKIKTIISPIKSGKIAQLNITTDTTKKLIFEEVYFMDEYRDLDVFYSIKNPLNNVENWNLKSISDCNISKLLQTDKEIIQLPIKRKTIRPLFVELDSVTLNDKSKIAVNEPVTWPNDYADYELNKVSALDNEFMAMILNLINGRSRRCVNKLNHRIRNKDEIIVSDIVKCSLKAVTSSIIKTATYCKKTNVKFIKDANYKKARVKYKKKKQKAIYKEELPLTYKEISNSIKPIERKSSSRHNSLDFSYKELVHLGCKIIEQVVATNNETLNVVKSSALLMKILPIRLTHLIRRLNVTNTELINKVIIDPP